MTAAHADGTDDLITDLDWIPSTEDDESVDSGGGAGGQRGIILDEVVPLVSRQAEAGSGIRLVLGNLNAQQRGAVHARQRLEHARLIDDGNDHRCSDLEGLSLGGSDDPVRGFA